MTNYELRIMNGGRRTARWAIPTDGGRVRSPSTLSIIRHSSFVIRHSSRAFTLVELLVVVGMIALIMGALTTAVSASVQRARIQKATSEVKMLTQAIHSYANYNDGKLTEISDWENVDFGGNLKYLSGTDSKIPVLIQAALSSDGIMRDPWGKPYQVKITKGSAYAPGVDNLKTGYYQPNFYRLTEDERK